VVREGIESGTYRDLPPALVAELFVASVMGMIDTMVFEGEFRKPDEIVPTLMDLFLRGLSK
jgi:hypothetical protein